MQTYEKSDGGKRVGSITKLDDGESHMSLTQWETKDVPFKKRLLSNAQFLRDCSGTVLSPKEAEALAEKLDVCAELIERLELQNEELRLRLESSNAKVSRDAD